MNPGKASDTNTVGGSNDPCLVCKGLATELVYTSTYSGSVEEAADYFLAHRMATAHGTIVRCRNCSFVFTSPRFSADDYDRIYADVRSPAKLDSSFEAAKTARFTRLAAIVREFYPHNGPFLDFGCGDGGFLRLLNSASGLGFEIGAQGRRSAGPSEIVTGDWAKLAGSSPLFPPDAFDFVVAFDVLEHLSRIEVDVARIRTVLKPGGFFFASLPNIESLTARLMGNRWGMLLLEHLWYFSPRTLNQMMAHHGFEMLATRVLPFDAPVAHIATRLAQTFGMKGMFKAGPLSRLVLPTPAGIMLGIFRKTN